MRQHCIEHGLLKIEGKRGHATLYYSLHEDEIEYEEVGSEEDIDSEDEAHLIEKMDMMSKLF